MERVGLNASRTFVLVHGGWHGGWCWRRVAARLEARGHRVLTPTLTGLADRSHLLSASVTLDTHVADIVNLFRWEALRDVTLVAHSLGGWSVSGALEQVGAQVAEVVYLDAFFPEDGERPIDLQPADVLARMGNEIARGVVGRRPPSAASFKIADRQDEAWVDAQMTPHPYGVYVTPIRLTGARERVAHKTYVRASGYPSARYDAYFAGRKQDPTWRTIDLPVGHDVMIDAPDALAAILLADPNAGV